MEDMSPELKTNVKGLFCGTLTNNVVSLDCNHVSRTAEEFYTVRCQVSEMRNLFQSLEEVTVKDTLEGNVAVFVHTIIIHKSYLFYFYFFR